MRNRLFCLTVLCLLFLLISFGNSCVTSPPESSDSSKSSFSNPDISNTSKSGNHLKAILNPTSKVDEAAKARIVKSYGQQPLRFEVNQGQLDKQVRFISRGPGNSIFFTPGEVVMAFAKAKKGEARGPAKGLEESPAETSVVRMAFVGANPTSVMVGEDQLVTKTNYFIGNDPNNWHTGVANYGKVRYREIYPGIDLVYYGNGQQLEYDFIVAPGADPKVIRLGLSGVEAMSMEAGDLTLRTASGRIIQKAPVIYQEVDGKRVSVEGNYIFLDDNQVAFYLGEYDTSKPLIIDPVIDYFTFIGSGVVGKSSSAGGITVGSAGFAYMTGSTSSTDLPGKTNSFAGNQDAFVTKVDPTGVPVFSTYIGGSNGEGSFGIALDSFGNIYITGDTTSTDLPGATNTRPEKLRTNHTSSFVSKVNADGTSIVYSTYTGGPFGLDFNRGIAVDAAGNVYTTGRTSSTDLPGKTNSIAGPEDAFVTRLNADGTTIAYSTYIGGSSFGEIGLGIALDSFGNIYIAGFTFSTDMPGATNVHFGGTDAFVTKLDAVSGAITYSTYIGGGSTDRGEGIAVDSSGNVYVTGVTNSVSLPGETNSSFGGDDAFVTKLDGVSGAIAYSTRIGGLFRDFAFDIALDSAGNIYITGGTQSTDLPEGTNLFAGDGDAFMSKLNADGTIVSSTYIGGSDNDLGNGIAVDASGNAYVTGSTEDSLSGETFVAKISPGGHSLTNTAGPTATPSIVDSSGITNISVSAGDSDSTHILNYAWTSVCAGLSFHGAIGDATLANTTWTAPINNTGSPVFCTLEVTIDDGAGGLSETASVEVTVNSLPPAIVVTGTDLVAEGPPGGPFTPPSTSYTVTNTGGGLSEFEVSVDVPWLTVPSGTQLLGVAASTPVVVSINTDANSLGVGTYTGTVFFDHFNGDSDTTRPVTLTVTAVDTTVPVIMLLGNNPETVEAGTAYVDAGATALDNIDGVITSSIVTGGLGFSTAVPGGPFTVTYDVSDAAGNPAAQVTRTVNVVDTTAPVIMLLGNNPETVEAGTAYVDAGATALDNIDGVITSSIVTGGLGFSTAVPGGPFTVTYDVSDAAGNPAAQVTRTVTLTVTAGNTPTSTVPITVVDPSGVSITYTSVEVAGNTTVTTSTTAPAIPAGFELAGLYYEISTTAMVTFPVILCIDYSAAGLTAIEEAALTFQHFNGTVWSPLPIVSLNTTTNIICAETLSFSGFALFITTASDTAPPVVTAPPDISVEATGPMTAVNLDPGNVASATDLVDGAITPTPSPTGPFAVGMHTITWSATDTAGNTGTATQTVTVQDTTPPAVTAPPDISVTATGPLTSVSDLDPGNVAGATDLVDGSLTPTPDNTGPFPPGQTTVTWSATDAAGNTGTATQLVTVSYLFSGFEPPIDNLPVINSAKAGRTLPLKWSLPKPGGGFIQDLSVVTGLQVQEVTCPDGPLVNGGPEDTLTAGESGLRYDTTDEQFVYNWKTSKSMSGLCFNFILSLTDLSQHIASFKLK